MTSSPFPDFQTALHWGLGRALVSLQNGTAGPNARGSVLDACLNSRNYDPQINGTHAAYLLEAAQHVGLFSDLAQLLAERLNARADPSDPYWDTVQQLDLLLNLAGQGDKQAGQAIRDLYARHSGDITLLHELTVPVYLALDKVPALQRVMQDEARAWHNGQDVNEDVMWQAEAALSDAQASRVIKALMASDPLVEAYVRAIQDTCRSEVKPATLPVTYEQTWAFIRQRLGKPTGPGFFRRVDFPAQDWQRLADDLGREQDTSVLQLLVGVFRYQPGTSGLERLLELTCHPDERVQWRAFDALAVIRHPDVRSLALQLLVDPQMARQGVHLLRKNAQAGDEPLVRAAIIQHQDADELHGVLFELAELVTNTPTPEFLTLLAEAYAWQPCSQCRLNAVETLVQFNALPDWLKHEASLDASPELRHLAATGELVP